MSLLSETKQKLRSLKPESHKVLYTRLFSLEGTPARLACAFSVGVFISFTPFYGLHTLFAVILAYLFQLNMIALVIGAWLNNPLTTPFIYTVGYYLGTWIIPGKVLFSDMNWHQIIKQHWDQIFCQLLLGCALLGIAGGGLAFGFSFYGIRYYRNHRGRETNDDGSRTDQSLRA